MIKKTHKIVATAIILANLVPSTVFAAKDYDSHWAKTEITQLIEDKIISGYPNGDFLPEKQISREEASVMINRLLGGETTGKSKFKDTEGRWSEGAIANLTENKVINGYTDGTFKPAANITREEFSTIIYNYLSKKTDFSKVKGVEFDDTKDSFAKEYIEKLAGIDIIKGYGKEFKPKNFITRAEAAKILYNVKNTDKSANEEKEAGKDVDTAKKVLKEYIETIKEEVFTDPSIDKEENKKAIENFKKKIDRAKELLEDTDIDAEELKEINELPFKVENDKKVKGIFNKVAREVLVDFQVIGERDVENNHNHKKYPKLTDNKIVVKSLVKGAGKIGENPDKYLKLNYVSTEQYDGKTEADAVSGATPRYDKQELPKEIYEVKTTDDGYEIILKALPEELKVKVLKPIIYVKVANGTYLENGDLVYID